MSDKLRPTIGQVTFLICTRNRLSSLEQCLTAINRQAAEPNVRRSIVIVNNGEPDDETAIRTLCPDAVYALEPRRGYSNARNTALRYGLDQTVADLFIFLDDDLIPDISLMKSHIATMEAFDADVTAGGLVGHKPKPEGAILSKVATTNVGFRRWIAQDFKFCPEANLLGHEDHEFFGDIERAGGKIVAAPGALVAENHPPGRQIDKHLMGRVSARNQINIVRRRHGFYRALKTYLTLYAPRAPRGLLLSLLSLLMRCEKTRNTANENLSLHRGAIEGFSRPGLDREMAKRGVVVEVE